MFEHKKEAVVARKYFTLRVARSGLFSFFILIFSLGIGVFGYHYICGLNWVDALLNASMILTGMGPVAVLTTDAGKIFASCYAIFSGVAFLTMASVMLSPFLHRFLHLFHLED